MAASLLDALLDEDTSEELYERLCDQGHDAERVVEIRELGDGVDDSVVHTYAEENDRIVITHDEGFFKRCLNSDGPFRLLWITDQQRFEPYQKARMIENALEVVDGYDSLDDAPRAIPLTAAYVH